jgi:mono/diheme cytochrome c family protein
MFQVRFSFRKINPTIGLLLFLIGLSGPVLAQDGKQLFSANCASCHAINKKLTGPALAGFEDRGPWGDRKQLYAWIKNPAGFMKTNQYTADLKTEYNGVLMTAFPSLTAAEIDAIVGYINTPVKDAPGESPVVEAAEASDNTLLYGILTLILAVVCFTLLQVNASLRKMADDKDGVPALEPIPVWKNKSYITLVILVLFLLGGYWTVNGAIDLGRQENYQPEQPIFYSHKVHAGVNQISCLYCHGGAGQGKHANIPSLNICMNCHMAINEYNGKEKLYTADGKEVDGTAEIQKLYKYAGFESGKPWDPSKAKSVEWIKIHNLPDHVYFNHSQHVVAGKVACQTCHGEIQKMDEVYQFSSLSMGWCINCHRETNVKFTENGFYSIYEKYHDAIKNGQMDSVTVEAIGGTECQKCHY